ncbi:hypothetical protein [Mycoplasmopsis gallinacea]|uniref:Uncharacterized protein n=1 Tax=Mycoplasmopsis gallinacea TaxID=29556 RepID=A0A6H0V4W2_9BACT|nr:hypothetical protein [Mycoplasmopsis gallinacea]QIW62013.1 hypothetical protein GOQ20_00830 [Mycoplasmopsis gallinacea]
MDKLKLYNWYGEEFDLIVPENGETLKAYKHQVNNLFDRLIDNVKNREKIDKDLFLRAKAKINDNLKRELNSHKIALTLTLWSFLRLFEFLNILHILRNFLFFYFIYSKYMV